MPRFSLFCATAALAVLSAGLYAFETMKYPPTRRGDVVDDHHGLKVPDPYRWLEDDVRKSSDVAHWVAAQNKVTFGYLERLPQRKALQKRIKELWDYERFSAPFKTAGRYFYFRNDGLQNQSVLYTTGESLDGEPRLLLDPNKLSKDGTIALTDVEVSPDGKLLAFGLAEAGSDWQTWKVMDIDTGKVRYILREFPLDPLAAGAFLLARCAGDGKYFEFVEELFKQQKNWALVQNPIPPLFAIAKRYGFTEQSFEKCLSDQKMLDGVEEVRRRGAEKFGVNSTPTFFVNGKIFRGAMTIEQIEREIQPFLKGS